MKLALAALALFLAASVAGAQAPTPAAPDPIDPEAVALAQRAGDFLRDAKRFSFSADSGYEVVQEDGAKLEFGNTRRYLVQRPDRVRVENEPRDGGPRLTLFDGKSFVMVDLDENAYARADLAKPRDIDFVIDLLRERLDAPMPLAELLRNNPRAALEDSLEAAAWIGTERLRGADCEHVALRNPDVDMQLWIESGEKPLVRRIVITYRTAEGQPSFWADLDDWSFTPELSDASFRYTPAKGAERVRFEVQPAPQRPQEPAQ
jgi:hypothetical protein